MAEKKPSIALIGQWRIVEADLLDRAHLDLPGLAILTTTAQGG
jgi:hypothetical protein